MQGRMVPQAVVTLLWIGALSRSVLAFVLPAYHETAHGHHGRGHHECPVAGRRDTCRLGLDRLYLFPSGPPGTGFGDSDRRGHRMAFVHDLFPGPSRLVHLSLCRA